MSSKTSKRNALTLPEAIAALVGAFGLTRFYVGLLLPPSIVTTGLGSTDARFLTTLFAPLVFVVGAFVGRAICRGILRPLRSVRPRNPDSVTPRTEDSARD